MFGIGHLKNAVQGTMNYTKPLRNLTDGAFQGIGIGIADKMGVTKAVSNAVANGANKVKDLFFKSEEKPVGIMQRAINFIQKPSFIGGVALSLGGLYAIGRMTETPETGKAKAAETEKKAEPPKSH